MPREHGLEVVDLLLLGVVVELEHGPSVVASLYERIHGTPRHPLPSHEGSAVLSYDDADLRLILAAGV